MATNLFLQQTLERYMQEKPVVSQLCLWPTVDRAARAGMFLQQRVTAL